VLIPVPAPFGAVLDGYRHLAEGGGSTPAHITLVPPTDIAADEWDGVVDLLASVAARHAPFRVRLRGTGTFRPISPVVFVVVVEGISSCEQLEASSAARA
jgi:2'-5' RNA ligase